MDEEHRVSLSDLSKKLSRYVHDIKDGPVTVTQRGEPVAVLIDFAEYRTLLEMEEQAEDWYWTVVALPRNLEFLKSPTP